MEFSEVRMALSFSRGIPEGWVFCESLGFGVGWGDLGSQEAFAQMARLPDLELSPQINFV